jgi:hypothetical protein
MAIRYSGVTIGTFTLYQKREETVDGKLIEVKDEKGRQVYNKFKIQLRDSNCLMCALHVSRIENPKNPKLCWRHQLVSFLCDEQHLKNCRKDYKPGCFFNGLFSGKLQNIKLNIYYKEMQTLAKYMARDGLNVTCYYKEPHKPKAKAVKAGKKESKDV